MYIIRVVVIASTGREPPVDTFVMGCDVDAFRGVGAADLTVERDEAMTFKSPGDALAFWRRQSNVKPFRDDGKPNGPLTAYTIEVAAL